jgi:hypothetical protein
VKYQASSGTTDEKVPCALADHVLASVFGLWSLVIPEERRFAPSNQLSFPYPGFSRVVPQLVEAKSRKAGKVV